MTIEQVRIFFKDKEDVPCPLTERLVNAGYQQLKGGYIDNAIKEGIEVDYIQNKPSQYWHLMSYCNSRDGSQSFGKNIVCGELIFWMAEVAECININGLLHLVECIIQCGCRSKDGRPLYDRIRWNKEIQDLCFDEIEARVCSRINNLETIFDHNVTKDELVNILGYACTKKSTFMICMNVKMMLMSILLICSSIEDLK